MMMLISVVFMMTGCISQKVNFDCPSFPIPKKQAIQKLQEINDSDINEWVVELYKLQKKLEYRENLE